MAASNPHLTPHLAVDELDRIEADIDDLSKSLKYPSAEGL